MRPCAGANYGGHAEGNGTAGSFVCVCVFFFNGWEVGETFALFAIFCLWQLDSDRVAICNGAVATVPGLVTIVATVNVSEME